MFNLMANQVTRASVRNEFSPLFECGLPRRPRRPRRDHYVGSLCGMAMPKPAQPNYFTNKKRSTMISIIMGSDSDLPIIRQAADVLEELGLAFELTIVSAHRTPERMFQFAQGAHERGIQVIIAGAGGAAHLPGMVASLSPLPVTRTKPRSR